MQPTTLLWTTMKYGAVYAWTKASHRAVFGNEQGLRRECVLAPVLFSIFFTGEHQHPDSAGVVRIQRGWTRALACLFDSIVLSLRSLCSIAGTVGLSSSSRLCLCLNVPTWLYSRSILSRHGSCTSFLDSSFRLPSPCIPSLLPFPFTLVLFGLLRALRSSITRRAYRHYARVLNQGKGEALPSSIWCKKNPVESLLRYTPSARGTHQGQPCQPHRALKHSVLLHCVHLKAVCRRTARSTRTNRAVSQDHLFAHGRLLTAPHLASYAPRLTDSTQISFSGKDGVE